MEPMLTVKEAAEYLNVCPMTVYRAVKAGTIPHIRIQRSIRFSREALDTYASTVTPMQTQTGRVVNTAPVIKL